MTRGLAGKRFGSLVVLTSLGRGGGGATLYHCRCDCGEYVAELAPDLTGGEVTSCGDCQPIDQGPSPMSEALRAGAVEPEPEAAPASTPKAEPEPEPEPLRRAVRPRRYQHQETPDLEDDPDAFLSWRLRLIGRIARTVMAEIEGQDSDLDELDLEAM